MSNIATKEEIKSMCRFIGGFKKWPLLNDDCKRKVLEVLDIYTRLSLGYCSKEDYSLMNTTPFHLKSIVLVDSMKCIRWFQTEDFDNVSVTIKRSDEMNWVFSRMGNDTRVRWVQKLRKRKPGFIRETILKNCDYYEEAVKFTEMWMKRCQFKVESIDIDMENYPLEKSQIVSLPKCTSVRIRSVTENELRWWLQKLPRNLQSLILHIPKSVISRECLSLQQVTNAKTLETGETDFSDEQLLSLKATVIEIRADSITDEGINNFIERWVNGNGVKDFHKLSLRYRPQSVFGELIKGLEVRMWDEVFRVEEPIFCKDFGEFWGYGHTCQIASRVDPFESLTVHFNEFEVSIAHTGSKMETPDGEPYTLFSVPPL